MTAADLLFALGTGLTLTAIGVLVARALSHRASRIRTLPTELCLLGAIALLGSSLLDQDWTLVAVWVFFVCLQATLWLSGTSDRTERKG